MQTHTHTQTHVHAQIAEQFTTSHMAPHTSCVGLYSYTHSHVCTFKNSFAQTVNWKWIDCKQICMWVEWEVSQSHLLLAEGSPTGSQSCYCRWPCCCWQPCCCWLPCSGCWWPCCCWWHRWIPAASLFQSDWLPCCSGVAWDTRPQNPALPNNKRVDYVTWTSSKHSTQPLLLKQTQSTFVSFIIFTFRTSKVFPNQKNTIGLERFTIETFHTNTHTHILSWVGGN